LATGGSATDTKAYEQWLKTNNITIEQVARALGISVAEAKKRYNLKGDAKDTGMGLGEYSTSGGSSDPYADSNPAWTNLSDSGKAAYYAANPLMANITAYGKGALQGMLPGYGLINGLPIVAGYIANMFGGKQDASKADVVSMGSALGPGVDPVTGLQGQGNIGQTGLHGDAGAGIPGGGFNPDGTVAGYNPTGTGVVVGGAIQDGKTETTPLGPLGGDSGGGPSLGDSYGPGSVADTGDVSGQSEGTPAIANGGLLALAQGGTYNLGDYSDGGRLLRGPGDGVSDSIPATIGKKRPARLADGEFVVPARIVSELGNGSTEAGARKLYAMMDRIQAARRSSIGKGKVAKNSRADKYLPA
jgi:hypothetical protein